MTLDERIAEFLARHNGQAFCDDCLRRTLKTPRARAVERATEAMGANPAYQRQPMFCALCANERPTIRALSPGFYAGDLHPARHKRNPSWGPGGLRRYVGDPDGALGFCAVDTEVTDGDVDAGGLLLGDRFRPSESGWVARVAPAIFSPVNLTHSAMFSSEWVRLTGEENKCATCRHPNRCCGFILFPDKARRP